MQVEVWEETVIIPTYDIGNPEKNPMFLENRVYQGSSGVVYPFGVIESISDEQIAKAWQAVFLENEYLKIMILPELGGRVQMAYDKVRERHFIYYNEVIKPALVGLTGPWISGGIEFNWPQHHRPTTFEPVDYTIEENTDGSKTVWCSEIDRMHGTKGMAGFTLYPNTAYLEIKAKLYNRTALPQTFLWWANPAVAVNEYYQSVFPPDVHAVFDHGRRDVSAFPIAKGTYYKVDYSAGVDISRYKNIPVPTSYMAVNSKYDFLGGYEHDTQGGILHIANRHLAPGKKQWTWGNGDFGQAWDRNLTDENGPYAELMCGVYTDNQPDFAWLMPYEEKSFRQYFMPYHELGLVKNATKKAILHVEIEGGQLCMKVLSTAIYRDALIQIKQDQVILYTGQTSLSPQEVVELKIPIDQATPWHELYFIVQDRAGKKLVDWRPEAVVEKDIPTAAEAARLPKEIESIEQLYLTGLHLEQYRHATYRPEDYYREGLRRDPAHAACNQAMGLWCLRRGKAEQAIGHFQTAVDRLTERNPNPITGTPFFYLGQALELVGRYDPAFDVYFKATWNADSIDTAYFHLARIAARRESWEEALELVDRSLSRNEHHHKARHLKVFLLRKLDEKEKTIELAKNSLTLDRFNTGLWAELFWLSEQEIYLQEMKKLLRKNIQSYIEFALDYAAFGAYQEAERLLDIGILEQVDSVYPLTFYLKAWFIQQSGGDASEAFQTAAQANPDFGFTNRLEEVQALKAALSFSEADALAAYYLGNFYYHHRQYDTALRYWEQSVQHDAGFPMIQRNLALAYFNKFNQPDRAVVFMEKAFKLDDAEARMLLELDQLYRKCNRDISFRLECLEQYLPLVQQRDDLYIERITLLNLQEEYGKAYELINRRHFHPWEGGEGKISEQYRLCLIELAKEQLQKNEWQSAQEFLIQALTYPHHLGEGKLFNAQDNDIYYWLGQSFARMGEQKQADIYFEKGTEGEMMPVIPWFYNDQQPDMIFYKGLSLMALNREAEASAIFEQLIEFGDAHLEDEVKMDYFAVSFPEMQVWDLDLFQKNAVHCHYMKALGYLGKGNFHQTRLALQQVLRLECAHVGAKVHLKLLNRNGLREELKQL